MNYTAQGFQTLLEGRFGHMRVLHSGNFLEATRNKSV